MRYSDGTSPKIPRRDRFVLGPKPAALCGCDGLQRWEAAIFIVFRIDPCVSTLNLFAAYIDAIAIDKCNGATVSIHGNRPNQCVPAVTQVRKRLPG